MAFLDSVARDIERKRGEWGEFALVFPNVRTINYFKRYYGRLIKRPEKLYIFPWQGFLESALGLQPAGQIELLFVLYQSFVDVLGGKEPFASIKFEEFFNLGQTILSDFNEVDNYLIDPGKIFVNLADLERLSDKEFLTREQQEAIRQFWRHYRGKDDIEFFFQLFSSLSDIYKRFRKRLLDLGRVYGGMRNRLIVDKLYKGDDLFSRWDTVAFIGFYALSKSELEIMNFIKKHHQAHFYWDYDNYYFQDEEHEAGFFLQKNISLLGEEKINDNDNLLKNKQIEVVAVPRNVAQAKILEWAFGQMGVEGEQVARTAIILLDESLLFPVLYSLPEAVTEVNITLQFPFYLASLYSFLDKWLFVLSQLSRNGQVYYKDFNVLLSSEVMQKFFPGFVQAFGQKHAREREVSINRVFLQGLKDADVLFALDGKKGLELIDIVLRLVYRIFRNADDFEREYIYHIHNNLQSLKKQLLDLGVDFSADVMISTLRQIFYSIRVPFQGQKMNALQIMTIMETRNLDFDNVIILSANEGIYPPIKRSQSFFSEFIRAAYGLPILRYQDSLYSYFFYRLIQRAKNVMLVYNAIPDKGAEGKSRYILQLEKETNLIKKHHVFTEILSIPVERDTGTIENLPEPPKAISVSAINTYITCPRKYFYKYIAGLQVPETTSDLEISDSDFGTVVHRTLELVYQELMKQTDNNITAGALNQAKDWVEDFLSQAWTEAGLDSFYDKGFFKVVRSSMYRYVCNVLNHDRAYAPFSIVSLEEREYKYELDLGNGKKVLLYGIIDRVDQKGDVIRLVDYKTGKKETNAGQMDKLFSDNHNKEVFQLLFYKLLVKNHFTQYRVVPVLYSLPSLRNSRHTGFIRVDNMELLPELANEMDERIIPEFEQRLQNLLRQILYEDKTFPKTDNTEACAYCDFSGFCGR